MERILAAPNEAAVALSLYVLEFLFSQTRYYNSPLVECSCAVCRRKCCGWLLGKVVRQNTCAVGWPRSSCSPQRTPWARTSPQRWCIPPKWTLRPCCPWLSARARTSPRRWRVPRRWTRRSCCPWLSARARTSPRRCSVPSGWQSTRVWSASWRWRRSGFPLRWSGER